MNYVGMSCCRVRSISHCLLIAGILIVAAPFALSQVGGRLGGRVTDPSNAVIPNARVDATNNSTNVTTSTQSNGSGYYSLQLQTGTYTVSASSAGFSTVKRENVDVTVGGDETVDFALQVASVGTVVEVNEEESAELITPTSATTQMTIDNKMVQGIPVEVSGTMRNASAFLALEPGYNGTSLNGGYSGYQPATVDGADVSAVGFGSGTQSIAYAMPVPSFAVQEFQVDGSNPDASVGRTSTGAISYALKSGTNAFHGMVFDYIRNTALDAKTFFQTQRGQDHQNEFGFDLGGPIKHDKTFFYGYYDGYRYQTSNTGATYSLLTQAMRNGDFTAAGIPKIYDPATTAPNGSGGFTRQQFSCNGVLNMICPNRFSKVSQYFASLYPYPQTSAITNNFVGTSTSITDSDQFLVKVDQTFSTSQRMSISYNWMRNPQTTNGPFGQVLTAGGFNPYHGDRGIINYYKTIGTSKVEHAILSYDQLYFNSHTGGQNSYTSGSNLNQQAGLTGVLENGFARINIGGSLSSTGTIGSTGTYYVGGGSNINKISHTVIRGADDFSWQRASHEMQFGAEILHYYTIGEQGAYGSGNWGTFEFEPQETGLPGVSSTGFNVASFLLGQVDGGGLGQNPSQAMEMPYYAVWALDKWKLRRNITVNYGLRWEYSAPVFDRGNRLSDFDPTLPNAAAGNIPGALVFAGSGPGRSGVRQFAHSWHKGWGPRLGVAYQVKDGTVLRAAYGLMWDTIDDAAAKLPQQGYFTQTTLLSTNGGVTPAFNWSTGFPPVAQGPDFDPTFSNGAYAQYIGANAGKAPEVANYNVGIQQKLPYGVVLDASYIGTQTHRMYNGNYNVNQLNPKYLSLGATLQAQVGSAQAIAAGISAPYAGFTGTVAQALLPYPQYQTITDVYDPLDNQHYNSFQAKVQKTFAHGYSLVVVYVYERNITNVNSVGAQNYYNLKAESAVASFDVPQNFTGAYTYELPIGRGKMLDLKNPVLNGVIGGWTTSGVLTFKSGTPIAPVTETTLPGFATTVLPNRVSGVSGYSSTSKRGTFNPHVAADALYLNSAAFALPPAFTLGNSTRYLDDVRTFGSELWNAALTKRFPLPEKLSFDFKAEAFDVTNRTNFGSPTSDIQSAAFGKITSVQTGSPRSLQVSGTVSW